MFFLPKLCLLKARDQKTAKLFDGNVVSIRIKDELR